MSRPHMMRQREMLLRQADGNVLEIGFGTGLNMTLYPDMVQHLTVLDPEALLPQRVAQRLAGTHFSVEQVQASAEHMPLESARFDTVISTWTLCTIPDVAAALAEVRRVLRPGGRLLFVEHGRSRDQRIARRQDRWNWLQQRLGGGCNMNRSIDELIIASGLELTLLDRLEMPKTPAILSPTFRGTAIAH